MREQLNSLTICEKCPGFTIFTGMSDKEAVEFFHHLYIAHSYFSEIM
jgi:hypothetical protein